VLKGVSEAVDWFAAQKIFSVKFHNAEEFERDGVKGGKTRCDV
jgi:hypothetical protein